MLIDGLYSGALDLHSEIDAVDVGDIQTWLTYSDDSTMTVAKSLDILGNIIWCFRTQQLSNKPQFVKIGPAVQMLQAYKVKQSKTEILRNPYFIFYF